jgi:hypothetical protein
MKVQERGWERAGEGGEDWRGRRERERTGEDGRGRERTGEDGRGWERWVRMGDDGR